MDIKKITVGTVVAIAVTTLGAAPVLAHDCFNPNKPEGAGINYNLVGFNEDGPVFEQTGPGKGLGGFVTLDPTLTGGVEGIEVMTLGRNPHGLAGGPGSQTEEHACDGQGIDYLEACFGE